MANKILGNRYEIQQLLAKKAGRKTLLARDLQTQELVVVKLLNFSEDFEWDDLKLFEREAETLKALSHPAIPRYLDYLELEAVNNSKGFALVQTYVAGKSLEEYLQAGRTFTEAEVKEIAKALLQILIYLHERQPAVVHRDIKPSNILLGDRSGNSVGQVYLVDFGSVQTLAATKGGTITVVGTYGYMPPEQFGDRAVPASDLYSLGATLITLVTGLHPADLPQKDGQIQFEHIANISPIFARWLQWMTEPSLDKRLSSAQEALKTLVNPLKGRNLVTQQQRSSKTRLNKTTPSSIKLNVTEHENPEESFLSCLFLLLFLCLIIFLVGVPLILALVEVNYGYPVVLAIFLALLAAPSLLPNIWAYFKSLRKNKNIYIKIDPKQVTVTEKIAFRETRSLQLPRKDISMLIYIRRRLEKPQIRIVTGLNQNRYEISNEHSKISNQELEWLAEELSSYLNIPLTRVRE